MLLLSLLPLVTAQAGLYGRLDAGLQLDNRRDDPALEQTVLADVHFNDAKQAVRLGVTLLMRQRETEREEQLQQLFFEKHKGAVSLRLGRIERSDGLGLYALDGGSFKLRRKTSQLELYAGRPGRSEAVDGISAKWLYGANLQLNHRLNWPQLEKLRSRIGLLEYQDDHGSSVSRISFALNSEGETGAPLHDPLQLTVQGNYLPESGRFEQFQARAITHFSETSEMSWSYQSLQPDESQPTLSGRFYNSYAREHQRLIALQYNQRIEQRFDWFARGRHVSHDHGSSGYGMTFGTSWAQSDGAYWQAEVDGLALAGDRVESIILQRRAKFIGQSQLKLSALLQRAVQQRGNDNLTVGAEARFDQRLSSELRLSLSAMQLINSNKDDEYRLALRLSYRFDDRRRGSWL